MTGPARNAAPDRSINRSVSLTQLLFGLVVVFVIGVQQLVSPMIARPGAFLLGVVITFVLCGLAVAVPWHLFGRGWIAIIPGLDIVAIVCLRYGQPPLSAGLLWIFPVIWLSSYFGAVGAITSVGLICLMIGVGIVISDDPVATASVPSVVILPLVLAAVAVSSSLAAKRSAARRRLLRSQARVLEASMIRARAQENLLADVLDSVDFGVVRVSPDGTVAEMNAAHARLIRATGSGVISPTAAGRAPDDSDDVEVFEVDGRTPIPPDETPMARVLRGEEFVGFVVWAGQPGRGTALSTTARRLRGAPGARDEGMVLVSRDVTTELAAVRARDDLVASVSHELRTPLTSIIGYVDLAADEEMTDLAARHLEVVERNANRMLGLVTDILAASSAGDRPIELTIDRRAADLADIAAAAVESLAPRASERNVTLQSDDIRPVTALVDAFRLRQVVDNLITNAIKYNRDGGSVAVRTGTDETGAALVVVSDTGTGIAPEEVPRLFDRFFRSEAVRGTDIHGSGLGLGISRDIVRGHGGELTIESELGTGSIATVRIPAEAE